MACIGMYYFWYVLHVLVYIVINLQVNEVICAGIDAYWLILESMKKMVCIVRIGMYTYVLLCIDLYRMHGMYWYLWFVLVCICMYQ